MLAIVKLKLLTLIAFASFGNVCAYAMIIDDSGWLTDMDSNGDGHGDLGRINSVCKGSGNSRRRVVTFDTGRLHKALFYGCCMDKSHLKLCQQAHTFSLSGLGMGDVAWHVNGFIDVLVDGESLGGRVPKIETRDDGDHGIATYVWELPGGSVEISFSADYGDEQLTLQVCLPQRRVSPGEIVFLCYPSSLALGRPAAERDRCCATAKRSLRHWMDKTWVRLSSDEFWLLYCDDIWDLGKAGKVGECGGPCALLYVPSEFRGVEVQVHNYEIYTRFECGGAESFNFLLWPSMGIPNAKALDEMKLIKIKEGK